MSGLHQYRVTFICFFLCLITLAAFWQVRNYDFIKFDDDTYVSENPHVRGGLTSENISWSFRFTPRGYWHPLTWLSHMLDCQLFGLEPGMHHLTNLILHLANTLLLFFVLNRMTGSPWKSGFVAALFALHPVNVDSVAWIANRKNVLSTFFWMLTMLFYVYYSEQPSLFRYLSFCALFVLGLMAKPMLVTLPFVLFLLDFWPLKRFDLGQLRRSSGNEKIDAWWADGNQKVRPGYLILEKVPLLVLVAISIALSSASIKGYDILVSTESVPVKLRVANALVSYVSYMAKMIWPQNLAVFYPYPTTVPMWQTVGAGFILVCVSFLALRAWTRAPYFLVGWLWYLGTLVPMIGLVQWGLWPAMADRFVYVPLIGLFIILSWGFPQILASHRYRPVVLAAAAGIILPALMTITWGQLRHWRNTMTLFQYALEVTDHNYLAHNVIGNVLFRQGKVKEASVHYLNALQLKPNYPNAHNNLGLTLAKQGRVEEAIAHYSEALKINPNFPQAHNNLGNALGRQGKMDEAIAHFTKGLELEPDFAGAHNNLGNLLARRGRLGEALLHFSRAVELKPDFAEAFFNMGSVLAQQGSMDEARSQFARAVELRPDFAEAHNSLGVILAYQGNLTDAIFHFQQALRLKPGFIKAQNNLKIALQQAGQKEEPSQNQVKSRN